MIAEVDPPAHNAVASVSSRPFLEESPAKEVCPEVVVKPIAKEKEERPRKVARVEPQANPVAVSPCVVLVVPTLVRPGKMRACLSGMDDKEKTSITKAISCLGGSVVDEVTSATLLVVNLPANRTPKFIIAVALGVPIVSKKYIEDGAPRDTIAQYVPELLHATHRYTSVEIARAIATHAARRSLPLDGLTFNLQTLPAKVRTVASDIIRSCGGTVPAKRKEGPDVVVLADDAESVYHKLLTAT